MPPKQEEEFKTVDRIIPKPLRDTAFCRWLVEVGSFLVDCNRVFTERLGAILANAVSTAVSDVSRRCRVQRCTDVLCVWRVAIAARVRTSVRNEMCHRREILTVACARMCSRATRTCT